MSQTKTGECGVEIVSKSTSGCLDTLDKHKETEKHKLLLELKSERSRKPSPSLEQKDGTSQMRLWCEGVQMDTEQAQTNPHAYEEIMPRMLTNTNTPTCIWFFQRG